LEDEKAINLTPNTYVNRVSIANNGKDFLIATLSGVLKLSRVNDKWSTTVLSNTTQFVAYNVLQDRDGNIWAGTDNGAYRFNGQKTEYYALPEMTNERVIVAEVYGNVHLLIPSNIYRFVPSKNTLVPAALPDISSSNNLEYIIGNQGVIWIKSNNGWHVLNGDDQISLLPYLELFENVTDLSVDAKGNLVVVDNGQGVYSILAKNLLKPQDFKIYIRQVVSPTNTAFSLEQISVSADESSLQFCVSAPFYLQSAGTTYQYRVEGLKNTWSRWNSDPTIDLNFLPAGHYVLQVRAKNVLGEISEIKSLDFTVEKPIWLRWYFILLYVVLLVGLVFGIIKLREKSLKEDQRRLEEQVKARTADLEKEKAKVEELILNILPEETAKELQTTGKATAKHYNQVSVLFTDFKGFTQFAENTKPEDLVRELDHCFMHFDDIIEKYQLEKIKTIGDAYMCAGGVPEKNSSNPLTATLAALEIRNFILELASEKHSRNENPWKIRIGIHTGPLTAGVVGKKKYAYDIWGDTVNLASRMESASLENQVNVSAATYELIKNYFECEPRGKLAVKGKGKVEMYFVTSIKPNYSVNGEGKHPNNELLKIIG
ncbi:adenylate/guanylate cyclase domain-containing protein, partial [Bacteroidota bacterium]